MPPHENAFADDEHAWSISGRVVTAVWRRATRAAALERLGAGVEAAFGVTPGPFGYLALVEAGCEPPDAEARAMIAKSYEEHGARLSNVIMAYEGSGLRATLVRTTVTAIFLLSSRTQVRPEVVATVSAGAALLEKRLAERGEAIDPKGVVSEIARLRSVLDARSVTASRPDVR